MPISAEVLIPVPAPLGGVVVVGDSSLTYASGREGAAPYTIAKVLHALPACYFFLIFPFFLCFLSLPASFFSLLLLACLLAFLLLILNECFFFFFFFFFFLFLLRHPPR